jgi:hypothetical protein
VSVRAYNGCVCTRELGVLAAGRLFALLKGGGQVDHPQAPLARHVARGPLRRQGCRRHMAVSTGRCWGDERPASVPAKVAWMTLPTLRLPSTLPPTPSSPMQSQMSAITRCVRAPDPVPPPHPSARPRASVPAYAHTCIHTETGEQRTGRQRPQVDAGGAHFLLDAVG